jgi:hypothetical protein
VPNPDQADRNGDGQGDACTPDADEDGVTDPQDNCPSTPNPDQRNTDLRGDGGDACDPDDDDDSVADGTDNCPTAANPDQRNSDGATDGDGASDADEVRNFTNPRDPNTDDDCFPDGADSAPRDPNAPLPSGLPCL